MSQSVKHYVEFPADPVPQAVKMRAVDFVNLARRHGYSITQSMYSVIAKKPGRWLFADFSIHNSEKVTNFQGFTRDIEGAISLPYVWQVRAFFKDILC
jgi:hypothetical protein